MPRCKPGDLAVVVRRVLWTCRVCRADGDLVRLGTPVTVQSVDARGTCTLEPPIPFDVAHPLCGAYARGRVISLGDYCLRPIRDPGDDASDETLEWLPVPSRDEVTA